MLLVSNKAVTNTVNRNLLTEESIEGFDTLLAIRQNFPPTMRNLFQVNVF